MHSGGTVEAQGRLEEWATRERRNENPGRKRRAWERGTSSREDGRGTREVFLWRSVTKPAEQVARAREMGHAFDTPQFSPFLLLPDCMRGEAMSCWVEQLSAACRQLW